jgi:hypothetical protein
LRQSSSGPASSAVAAAKINSDSETVTSCDRARSTRMSAASTVAVRSGRPDGAATVKRLDSRSEAGGSSGSCTDTFAIRVGIVIAAPLRSPAEAAVEKRSVGTMARSAAMMPMGTPPSTTGRT